jgi:spermidine synthase
MLKKILSYIFPITRIIKSDYNGYLELTMINGRTLLDTANANYSYGSLQKVLKFSLEHIKLSTAENVLLLGLGGGCVVKTLRNDFGYCGPITAVDVDPVIIDIAEKEFGILPDYKTQIACTDAFDFVKNDVAQFDLIIIDLFIDNKVPEKFLTREFWREIVKKIKKNGTIIFNTLCTPFTDIQPVEEKLKKRGFDYHVYRYVENTNKVLIASYNTH